MRCLICGLVVDGSESPTAREIEVVMTACRGCHALFSAAVKAGMDPHEAMGKARTFNEAEGIAKYEQMQRDFHAAAIASQRKAVEDLAAAIIEQERTG